MFTNKANKMSGSARTYKVVLSDGTMFALPYKHLVFRGKPLDDEGRKFIEWREPQGIRGPARRAHKFI